MSFPVVDIHCHLFDRVTGVGIDLEALPSAWRAEAMLDAGSCGPDNFDQFAKWAERSRERGLGRVFGLVNVAARGLDIVPEIQRPEDFQPERAAEMALRHPGIAKGLKLRAVFPALGILGLGLIERSIAAAGQAALPVMVHFGQQGEHREEAEMLTVEVLDRLRAGDIASHIYTGQPGGAFATEDGIAAARRARARGVLFDIGHGGFNFSIAAARQARAADFPTDFISSDVTRGTSPWLSLPYAMSAVASAGFAPADVVTAVTEAPALWLGLSEPARLKIDIHTGDGTQKDSFGVEYPQSHRFAIVEAR